MIDIYATIGDDGASTVASHTAYQLHQLRLPRHQRERRVADVKNPLHLIVRTAIKRKAFSVMSEHHRVRVRTPTPLIAGVSCLLQRADEWREPGSLSLRIRFRVRTFLSHD